MAPHDRANQPQAPDLGASVQLESGQTLEDDLDTDPLDAGYIPPDRPYGLDEDGVTGSGMREGDSLDQRLSREQDAEPADPDRAGRITAADQEAALQTRDDLQGVDVGVDGGAASAEEAAMHEVDEAWVGSGGAPVESEPSVAEAPSLADPELEAALAADPAAARAAAQARRDLAAAEAEPGPDQSGSEQ